MLLPMKRRVGGISLLPPLFQEVIKFGVSLDTDLASDFLLWDDFPC